MEQSNQPKSLKVVLSDQNQVMVNRITWSGWRLVKEKMLEALSASEVARALSSLIQTWKTMDLSALLANDGANTDADVKKIGIQVMEHLASGELIQLTPPALRLLNRALDDMTAELLEHCTVGETPERVMAEDVIELRSAIFKVNDFAGLLAAEKNSLSALVGNLAGAAKSESSTN